MKEGGGEWKEWKDEKGKQAESSTYRSSSIIHAVKVNPPRQTTLPDDTSDSVGIV